MIHSSDIQIRDPFILPEPDEQAYYLFGTTDTNPWHDGIGEGFNCYRSTDLQHWEGPFSAFRPSDDFWAERNFWAPEVHKVRERYYMLASFKAEGQFRGTQILAADNPMGPYEPLTNRPVTPAHWECLDGTLYIDEQEHPWIVFCQEWTQIHDGAIHAMRLSPDLRKAIGRPVFLFNASEAPWAREIWWPPQDGEVRRFPCYVTDGPSLFHTAYGELIMIWSSCGDNGYTIGAARSASGKVTGPWIQDPEPVWADDGGHGMTFRTFEGRQMLTFHTPNVKTEEHPFFIELDESGVAVRAAPQQEPA